MEQELYGTGGFTYVSSSNPGFTTNPVNVSAGVWVRSSSTGQHFTTATGVLIAGLIGINLSVDTNYDSGRTLSYRLVSNGKIYGSNAVPSLASMVRTGR
ncbi:MAG: hypothetical protein V4515_05860 [Chloroflexota bacterium]